MPPRRLDRQALPEALEEYIRKAVGRGEQPSDQDLLKAAKKAGIPPPPRQKLRDYKLYYAHLANLTSRKARAREFATIPLPILGLVFIDLAFYRPQWAKHNGGHKGFLVAVEASTQQLAAFPMKGKTTDDWRKAVLQVLDESVIPSVKTFVCDREPAVFSKHFRTRLSRERGVDIKFLTRRHKSYRAESMIRWVKVALTKTVNQRVANGDPDFRGWADTLPAVVKSFNRRSAHGTSFRRSDIRLTNYHAYLNELFQTDDSSLLLNTGNLNADRLFSDRWLARLFKFKVGDEVLVHRSATRQHGEAFAKPSVEGSFRQRPARVQSRWLKRSLNQFLVPGEWRSLQGGSADDANQAPSSFFFFQCTSSRTRPPARSWRASTTEKSFSVSEARTEETRPAQPTAATTTLRQPAQTTTPSKKNPPCLAGTSSRSAPAGAPWSSRPRAPRAATSSTLTTSCLRG